MIGSLLLTKICNTFEFYMHSINSPKIKNTPNHPNNFSKPKLFRFFSKLNHNQPILTFSKPFLKIPNLPHIPKQTALSKLNLS